MDCVGAVCVWHIELALQRAIECTRAPAYYCKQIGILAANRWSISSWQHDLLQMLNSKTLHPYGFIVAHVVVEGVALATKVIHNGLWTQWGHHLSIVPGKSQMILWSWCHLPVRHGQGSCTYTFPSLVWLAAGKRWYICVSRWQSNSIQAMGQCQCLAANRVLARLYSFEICLQIIYSLHAANFKMLQFVDMSLFDLFVV